jgi:hypothetical protein
VRLAPRPARRPLSVNLADVKPKHASASQPEVATSAKRPRLDVPVEPGLHPMDCDASQGQASSDTPINIARRPHKVLQVKVDPCAHLKITDDDIYRRFVPDEIADDDDDDDDEVREEEERKRKQATNSALVFWQVNSHLWTVTFDPTSSEFVDYHELLLRWNSDHVKGQFEHEDDTAWTEEPKAKKATLIAMKKGQSPKDKALELIRRMLMDKTILFQQVIEFDKHVNAGKSVKTGIDTLLQSVQKVTHFTRVHASDKATIEQEEADDGALTSSDDEGKAEMDFSETDSVEDDLSKERAEQTILTLRFWGGLSAQQIAESCEAKRYGCNVGDNVVYRTRATLPGISTPAQNEKYADLLKRMSIETPIDTMCFTVTKKMAARVPPYSAPLEPTTFMVPISASDPEAAGAASNEEPDDNPCNMHAFWVVREHDRDDQILLVQRNLCDIKVTQKFVDELLTDKVSSPTEQHPAGLRRMTRESLQVPRMKMSLDEKKVKLEETIQKPPQFGRLVFFPPVEGVPLVTKDLPKIKGVEDETFIVTNVQGTEQGDAMHFDFSDITDEEVGSLFHILIESRKIEVKKDNSDGEDDDCRVATFSLFSGSTKIGEVSDLQYKTTIGQEYVTNISATLTIKTEFVSVEGSECTIKCFEWLVGGDSSSEEEEDDEDDEDSESDSEIEYCEAPSSGSETD